RVLGLPALVKGLFYEPDCQDAGFDLVRRWTVEDCRALYADVTRGGFRARLRGIAVHELARELLRIADEGLRRQRALDPEGRDERRYLEPIVEQVESGRTAAERVAERWKAGSERRMARLVASEALRA